MDLFNQPTPATTVDKTKAPKIHHVHDQEWVSLIVNILKQCSEQYLRNVLCLGKFADPETMHKAYTGSVLLNPLYCSKKQALECDRKSRQWIANIQGIGDDVPNLKKLVEMCLAPNEQWGPYKVVVVTDNPQEALKLFQYPYEPLIISTMPVPGFKGMMSLRSRGKEYTYFFNCEGRKIMEYETDMLNSNHLTFSSFDHVGKIVVNFKIGDLGNSLIHMLNSGGQVEVVPVQYLDTKLNLVDQRNVVVPTTGIPKASDLVNFMLSLVPESLVYNPVEMRETSLFEASTNPLFTAAIGYDETVKFYESLGLAFPDSAESKQRVERHAESYKQQTIPMIKPTGDQLLAYYKPGFYAAKKDFFITLGGKKVPVFVEGKEYYIYPLQHSEVLELPETQLLDASSTSQTSRTMSLHCTYTALSFTSELKPAEIKTYNSDQGDKFKVITAEEYELARKIQTAVTMGNNRLADELRDRLKSQHGRRLHVTSKDPNLASILTVFPPPDVKTLSEAYPALLRQRITTLRNLKAQLTDVQMLHAALASLKRGVVFTHNVGSGKTRIAAYAAIASGAKRIAFIAKSKILGEVMKELQHEIGVSVTHIHSASCIRAIKAEIKREAKERQKIIQTAKTDGVEAVLPEVKPKFYVISQEFLTIGGLANQTFDPYLVDITETLAPNSAGIQAASATGERIHTLKCTRENAEKEIKEQILKLRADGVITGSVKRIPFRFHQHVQECPTCMSNASHKLFSISARKMWNDLTCATRKAVREQVVDYVKRGKLEVGLREFGTFSKHGHCLVCGYLARSYRRVQVEDAAEVTEEVADLLEALGEEEKSHEKGKQMDRQFSSALQFPAYRLLKDVFDCKICDEAHTLTGESKVYEAVGAIHTDRTYLLSGTLLRRTPAEMWQVFTLLWGYRSPEFPYGYEHQTDFVEQHVTYRVTRDTVKDGKGKKSYKQQKQEMPEPANAPKLWRFLHQAQLHATNKSMGLQIPDVKRHFLEIPFEGDALAEYDNKLAELKTSYVNRPVVFSLQNRADWFTRINELQSVALTAKLSKLMPLIIEYVSAGRNIIVACKQQKTFERLIEQFKAEDLDFIKLDEKKPAQPHKRREWLDENYVQSKTPILLTRTPLINESLNNLVKASVIIVVEAEYVFYPLQQLEGRIARPKQKCATVDVVYMVTHHPRLTSVDEAMLQMALRRNNANIELVSGNVTQRTNEQLVEMAENQKMREMELMQTLLKGTKAETMDYGAEFAAREDEIEKAEKTKAQIVVDNALRQQLDTCNITASGNPAPVADKASLTPVVAVKADVAPKRKATLKKNEVAYKLDEEGENYLLALDVPQVDKPTPKKRTSKKDKLMAAMKSLKDSQDLTLFGD